MQPLSLAIRRPDDLDDLLHVSFEDSYNEYTFNGSVLARAIDSGMPDSGRNLFPSVHLLVRRSLIAHGIICSLSRLE